MTIRAKLLALYAALAVAPMALVGAASYLNSVRAAEGAVREQVSEDAALTAGQLGELLEPRRSEVELLAWNQEIQQLYADLEAGSVAPQRRRAVEAYLRQFVTGEREILRDLRWFDAGGEQILAFMRPAEGQSVVGGHSVSFGPSAVTFPVRDAPADTVTMAGAYDNQLGALLSLRTQVRAFADDRLLGYLRADIAVADLVDAASRAAPLAAEHTLYVADRSTGRFVHHPNRTRVGERIEPELPGLEATLRAGDTPDPSLSSTVAGRELFVGSASAPGDLVALVTVDPEPHVGPARAAALVNAGIAAGAVLLALVVLPLTIGRITRSIRRVADGAEAIAAGDLDQQIDVAGNDETSMLAGAFNRMAASLKGTLGELRALAAELEDRVRARTAELEAANREMEVQRREVEIDRELERVRTAVAGMEGSDDIEAVMRQLLESLQALDFPCDNVGLNIVDREAGTIHGGSMGDIDVTGTVPLSTWADYDVTAPWQGHWERGEVWLRTLSPDEVQVMFEAGTVQFEGQLERQYEADPGLEQRHEQLWAEVVAAGGVTIVDIPFTHGTVAANRVGRNPFTDDDVALLRRFTEVFALGYRRHLDLKAAEDRARQAELERAVERVRAAAMEMRSADDIRRLVAVVFNEMRGLGIDTPAAAIIFVEEGVDTYVQFDAGPDPRLDGYARADEGNFVVENGAIASRSVTGSTDSDWLEPFRTQTVGTFSHELTHEHLRRWHEIESEEARWGLSVEDWSARMTEWFGPWTVTNVPFRFGQIGYRERQADPRSAQVVGELAAGLELGFLRFLDFQRLERQNRELEVEQALERVRTAVAEMESSDSLIDLRDRVQTELQGLGVPTDKVSITTYDPATRERTHTRWGDEEDLVTVSVDATETDAGWFQRWSLGESWGHPTNRESVERVIRDRILTGHATEELLGILPTIEPGWMHSARFDRGSLSMRKRGAEPFANDHVRLLERFTEVFALGYRRHLDLKAAEDRAHQAELERAVERVRAAAMDMRSSDDIRRVAAVVHHELTGLGVETPATSIQFIDEDEQTQLMCGAITDPRARGLRRPDAQGDWVVEGSAVGANTSSQAVTDLKPEVLTAWREQRPAAFGEMVIDPANLRGGLWRFSEDLGLSEADQRAYWEPFGGTWKVWNVPFRFGQVGFDLRQEDPAAIDTVAALAAGLEIGYLRFLDFQRLERQNRELAVEQALERLRTAIAGMQGSGDLDGLVAELKGQLDLVGVRCDAVGINIVDAEARTIRLYGGSSAAYDVAWSVDDYEHFKKYWAHWQEGAPWVRYAEPGSALDLEMRSELERDLATAIERGLLTEAQAREIIEQYEHNVPPEGRTVVDVPFAHGALAMNRVGAEPFSDDDIGLMRRFTEVFALGYRRHLDLKAAEERARNAEVERELEKLRTAVAGMSTSDDLHELAENVLASLQSLGVPCVGCSVNDVDEDGRQVTLRGEGEQIEIGLERWEIMFPDWMDHYRRRVTFARRNTPADKRTRFERLADEGHITADTVDRWMEGVGDLWVVDAFFDHGGLAMNKPAPEPFSDADVALLERFTEVFALGYRRYLDLIAAEERARAAEVARAQQHVRTVVSSMERTEDIERVITVLRDELRGLDVPVDAVGINIVDEAGTGFLGAWNLGPAGSVTRSEASSGETISALIDRWREGSVWHRERSEANPDHAGWVVDVPFDYGTLAMNRHLADDPQPFSDEEIEVLKGFADVVSLGYSRFRDFQRLDEQNRALEEANVKIQEANRLKSEFLANMSHELRTPMNAIVGFSKIIRRRAASKLDDRQRDNLDKVLNSAEMLMALINDILDLSKIEAGRLEVEVEEFDLPELISASVDTVTPMLKSGVDLSADVSGAPTRLSSDPARVRQIVINLLSNAAKFTESGHVSVAVRTDDERVHIAVSDTGIGIPPDKIELIFEEFRQADGTTTRKYGGTGLGLSISRRLAQMLGGDITVDSVVGEGSTFTLVLPLAMPEARPEAPAAAAPPAVADGRRVVLAIDDDPDVISLITQELEEEGYHVIGAQRALEGIQKAQQVHPAAITLDIMMPGMDGWEAVSRLKSDPATSDIPVIILSIIDNEELGYRLGADEYLVKPVDREALARVLRKYEGRGGQVLVCDDDPVVIDLARQLLEEEGWTVRAAVDGQQALDAIAAQRPDVLLLDLMMPVMDGFETLRRLRADEATADLPVVVITAKDLAGEELAELRASTSRVIEKDGLDRDRILRELRQAMRQLKR